MSVTEYRARFLQLARYAPADVADDRKSLTWLQFRERFRSHNVPVGVMKMKQKEFLALKQVILNIIIERFLLS